MCKALKMNFRELPGSNWDWKIARCKLYEIKELRSPPSGGVKMGKRWSLLPFRASSSQEH
jgi:hypothetical protein